MVKFNLCFLLVSLWCCGVCWAKSEGERIPVHKLDENIKGRKIPFSELVTGMEMIRLETPAEGLVPGYYDVWCGDRYLLILGSEEVLQFARDGKFIRRLAVRGRAPGEYQARAGFLVDEARERFYITDWSDHMVTYDLATGKFLDSRKMVNGVMTQIQLTSDNKFVYIPYLSLDATMNREVCQTDLQGKLEWELKGRFRNGREEIGNKYLGMSGDEIHYMSDYADTLYSVRNGQKDPLCVLEVPNRYNMQKKAGNIPVILAETSDWLLVAVNEQNIKDFDGGREVINMQQGKFLIHKKTRQIEKVRQLYLDGLVEVGMGYEMQKNGRYLCASCPMLKIREMAEYVLQHSRLSPEKETQLKRLLEETQDDDNPVIFLGKVK